MSSRIDLSRNSRYGVSRRPSLLMTTVLSCHVATVVARRSEFGFAKKPNSASNAIPEPLPSHASGRHVLRSMGRGRLACVVTRGTALAPLRCSHQISS